MPASRPTAARDIDDGHGVREVVGVDDRSDHCVRHPCHRSVEQGAEFRMLRPVLPDPSPVDGFERALSGPNAV